MVRQLIQPAEHACHHHFQTVSLAIGMFACVSVVVGLCAKHTVSKISKNRAKECNSTYRDDLTNMSMSRSSPLALPKKILTKITSGLVPMSPPGSPLVTPKKILATISSKAITPFIKTIKKGNEEDGQYSDDEEFFREEGLWQKNILMGDKCEPLDFSGVIYYDHRGNQIPTLPRSPKAAGSPLPGFSFPVVRVDSDDSDLEAV